MMKKMEFVFRVVCGLFLLFLAVKLLVYHYNFVVYPFPNEYREGAMMTTTSGLVKGVNPFELQNQPQYMNDYGIFYSIVTWPFAKVFGVTLLVHRLVTAFFILACCGLMFWVMRRFKADVIFSSISVVLFYAFSLYPSTTTPMANPSSLGLFLFLLALLVPWSKGFSWGSLMVSIPLGILAYYTKPYFLLCVPMLALYLFLCVSKRKAVVFSAVFAFFAFLSILFVHHQWNCYFANCFFLHTNPGHLSWSQSIRQLNAFINLNLASIIGAVAVFAVWLFKARKDLFRVFRERRPLSFLFYCTIVCFFALVFWLGKHEEAFLWYYFHLLSPFFLVCTAVILSRQLSWTLIVVPLLLWNCWTVTLPHERVKFDALDPAWLNVKEMIATHKDILNSPVIAPLLVEQNRPVYDNGLSEYFKKGGYRESGLVRQFSRGDPRIILRYYAFMNEVRGKIKRREFDLVMLVYNYAPLVPGELKEYYRMLGVVNLKTPGIFMEWPVTVWVPNDK